MGLPQVISRNQMQAAGLSVTVEGRVTDADVGLYTVPTGKVSRVVSITGRRESLGADTLAGIAIKRGVNFRAVGNMIVIDEMSSFNGIMLLQAGDIVTNVGDSGATNTTFDMTCTFKEFNA